MEANAISDSAFTVAISGERAIYIEPSANIKVAQR